VHEIADKWPVSAIDEAIANIDHQIVISALQWAHGGRKNASRVSSRPITRRMSPEPMHIRS
jgi:hypothetical protein